MSILHILVPAAAVLIFVYARRRREQLERDPEATIEIAVRVPRWAYRAAQSPLVFWPITSLTGVSVTLVPLYLFVLGGGSVDRIFEWEPIACLLVIFVVPAFYMQLAGPVLQHARRHPTRAS